MKTNDNITLPKPFAVAVDDLGWMNGGSLAESGGPWRIGFKRKMELSDYHPFVEVGKAVGVRIQTLFTLAEMDRLNVLKNYPTATQAGKNWDNSSNVSFEQLKIIDYVKDNSAYMEFGLHGVGHEHWENGKRTRAEWYDMENDKPWSEKDTLDHIKAYKEILAQYGLTKENGHSFPESFVPCSWAMYWNPDGDYSTAKALRKEGVKFANTWFETFEELNPPVKFGGGIDHGMLVVNRYNYGNEWYMVSSTPKKKPKEFKTNVIESHWANWLATDEFLQPETNRKWIDFYKGIQKSETHYLAKNTEQFSSQWLYMKFAKIKSSGKGKLIIDNRKMPDEVYENDLLGALVIKIKLKENEHLSEASINGESISAYFEDAGCGFIYLSRLQKKNYELKYKTGKKMISETVYNDGTYNVYRFSKNGNEVKIDLKMYGTQEVKVYSRKPKRISISNKNLKLLSKKYDEPLGLLRLKLKANDFQGERGIIKLNL
ncbi:MAG: hypothetical protein GXO87_14465 [Chlorobi bacterium]|nr:hypothetical protein [Chlorobiota bacterium]